MNIGLFLTADVIDPDSSQIYSRSLPKIFPQSVQLAESTENLQTIRGSGNPYLRDKEINKRNAKCKHDAEK